MTPELSQAAALGLLIGAMIPAGGVLAAIDAIVPRWRGEEMRHAIIAFCGGALLAAVVFVLIPQAEATLGALPALALFLSGALAFAWADGAIARHLGESGQFVAMLADFLPETLALGALLAGPGEAALLLALLIALQNLPEGFNAYRELAAHGRIGRAWLLARFAAIALLGPAMAVAGMLWLQPYPAFLGAIMIFAGGGILYLLFGDIAPQVPLARRRVPPVAGMAPGLDGQLFLHGYARSPFENIPPASSHDSAGGIGA